MKYADDRNYSLITGS